MALNVILFGVRSGSFGNFRSAISASPRPSDDNILVDDDTQRPAGPDAHRRLDIEIAGDELGALARAALLRGLSVRPHKVALPAAPTHFPPAPNPRHENASTPPLPPYHVELFREAP